LCDEQSSADLGIFLGAAQLIGDLHASEVFMAVEFWPIEIGRQDCPFLPLFVERNRFEMERPSKEADGKSTDAFLSSDDSTEQPAFWGRFLRTCTDSHPAVLEFGQCHPVSVIRDHDLCGWFMDDITHSGVGIIGVLNQFQKRNFRLLYKPFAELT
jgi:hypothetical protein